MNAVLLDSRQREHGIPSQKIQVLAWPCFAETHQCNGDSNIHCVGS